MDINTEVCVNCYWDHNHLMRNINGKCECCESTSFELLKDLNREFNAILAEERHTGERIR
jgi:hypothetical protein